jgi:ketol-acid reductoisomerase
MIKLKTGEKGSPKDKAKEILRGYFDKMVVSENCVGYDDLTDKEVNRIQEQIVKIKERMYKPLVEKNLVEKEV